MEAAPAGARLAAMKVRIGFGLGTHTLTNDGASFGALVDALEDLRFDSLWVSDQLTGPAPDPLAALAFAAGRTRKLKLGTSVLILPGRNPVVLAKEMATIKVAVRLQNQHVPSRCGSHSREMHEALHGRRLGFAQWVLINVKPTAIDRRFGPQDYTVER